MTGLVRHLRCLREFVSSELRGMLAVSAMLLTVTAAVGWSAALFYPQQVQTVLEQFAAAMAQTGVVDQETGAISALGLMANNWRAFLMMTLYGFVPFLPLAAVTLGVNGLLLGLLGGWYQANGMSVAAYWAGILPHGVLELGALLLAASCGLALCRNMSRCLLLDRRRQPMVPFLENLLRVLLLLVFPMTAAAALIEAYVTPIVMSWFM